MAVRASEAMEYSVLQNWKRSIQGGMKDLTDWFSTNVFNTGTTLTSYGSRGELS